MSVAKRTDLSFTVFTPTYNRARTLERVYASLRAQTFRDFEWLVVDDGSEDETPVLVSEWESVADFPIRYLCQSNLGKAAASNRAVEEARGRLFLTLDSDDACVPHALERLKYHWDSIPDEERTGFSGVTAVCVDQNGKLVGDEFPSSPLDSDSLEIRLRYKVRGEKWGFQRTDVLRRFPLPMSDRGPMYIPEGLVWRRIARQYKTRFVNERLRIYWYEDGAEDHISIPRDFRNAVGGFALNAREQLNWDLDWFHHAPAEFLKAACQYSRFSLDGGISLPLQARSLQSRHAKLLWAATLPAGAALYWMDRTGIIHRVDPSLRRLAARWTSTVG